jgi:hypothetical protein
MDDDKPLNHNHTDHAINRDAKSWTPVSQRKPGTKARLKEQSNPSDGQLGSRTG